MTHRRIPSTRLLAGASAAGCLVLLAATPAFAYVGPGAGLSLLGALWGVIAAVVAALAFVVIWPMRRLVKRRSARSGAVRSGPPPSSGEQTRSS